MKLRLEKGALISGLKSAISNVPFGIVRDPNTSKLICDAMSNNEGIFEGKVPDHRRVGVMQVPKQLDYRCIPW